MINVSSAWNRAIFNDKRDYLEYVDITLANGTVLNLTNANIWEGGFSIEDAVSSDSDLQLGTAIINKFTLCINNMYDDFSGYVFEDARLSVRVGLVTDTSTEVIQKGRYIVENASYNGDLITLECYDYMRFFDVPYSDSNQVYPATLDNIVRNACTDIGITLNTPNFPHKTFVVQNRPEDEATTYREVIAWAAQVAGCYARMNPNGQLELKWYDQAALSQALEGGLDGGIFDTSTPYSTGDQADGGSFNPWNTGYVYDSGVFSNTPNVHMISSLYSEDISVDDVVITGVRILVKTQSDEQNGEVIKTFQQGSNGYVIEISENPMITISDANTVLQWLATQLIGFTFRKANISHGSNPAIEAGDVAIIFDRKGGIYPIIVSKTSFSVGSSQTTVSAAQTPSRNSAARFSAETKNYVELRKRLKNERTTREQIEAQLAQQIEESNGLYETDEVQADQSVKHYLHNKPDLEDSDIQILVSSVGITVTANGTDPNPTWYGLTVNGDLIARILTATGVNADWINAGQLVIRDQNGNETFFADTTTGVVRINAASFSLTGTTIDSIAQSKANAALASANSYTDSSTASAKSYSDNQLADYKDVVDGLIEDLQDQIDGQFETYYYDYEPTLNNYPANQWTTDAIKKEHEGDMFLWKSTGYAYRFFNMGTDQSPVWKWQAIQDSVVATALATAEDALALAGVKRRIFTAQPTPPYDQKDLWVQGSNGDIMVCATSRATGSYVASDWERASKYTDDSALESFISGDFADTIDSVRGQIDSKAETWYQSTDPSTSWTSAEKPRHEGDLWYKTTDNSTWRYDGSAWVEQLVPTEVFDKIDTKKQIFVTTTRPTPPYDEGDLWAQGSTGDIYYCKEGIHKVSGDQYDPNDWAKGSKYTDDTTVKTQYGTCATAAGTAAKVVTLTGFKIYNGARISVKFTYANTAGSPTLNVNSTGAKSIRAYGSALTATSPYNWSANSIVDFVYDGTYWNISDSGSLAKAKAVIEQMTQEGIFNLLTNNGTIQGIFMQDGQLFINASYIQSGTLKLGGADNASGTLQVKNANGYTVVDINNTRSQFDGYDSSNVRTGRIILRDGSAYAYKYDSSSSSLKQVLLINYYSSPDVGTITMGSNATQMEIGSHNSNLGKLRLNNDWWATSGSTSRPINYAQNDGIKVANTLGGGLLVGYGGIVQDTSIYENFLYRTTTRYLKCLTQFQAVGTKSRLVKTDDYANRLLYCYETPTPMFGDVGEGVIGEDGKCYVTIDPVFAETVSLNQYQVFLQKYGAGDCYVSERKSSYFVVEGTPNMAFGWEMKAKQSDFDQLRLDRDEEAVSTENTVDYVAQAEEHINELMKERGITE